MLLAISTVVAFLVTAAKGCPVPSPSRKNLSVSSLANVNLYRYYDLENKDYNVEFLRNAFKELYCYPKCTLAKHIALVDTIPFLNQDDPGRDTRTLRSLVEEALQKSRNTAIEDIVKFRVAYILQIYAAFYLHTLFSRDNLEQNIKQEEVSEEQKKEAFRHLGAAERILRKAVTTGDVPEADISNSLLVLFMSFNDSPEELHRLHTEAYEVLSLWDDMLLEGRNIVKGIVCEADANAVEQPVSNHQNGNSGKEPSVPAANHDESVNSSTPHFA